MRECRRFAFCAVLSVVLLPATAHSHEALQRSGRAIVLSPPSALEREAWQLAREDPRRALVYLDWEKTAAALAQRCGRPRAEMGPTAVWLYFLVLQQFGDTGGGDILPAIEEHARSLEEKREETGPISARFARLCAERIRLRQQGRAAYLNAMIEWVRTPKPASVDGADPVPETLEATQRTIEGVRALGVLRAAEAVPVLIEWYDGWGRADVRPVIARALARIGDARALPVLERELRQYVGYHLARARPLEPEEVDVGVAYWNLRLAGKTPEQRVAALVKALEEAPLARLRPGAMLRQEGERGLTALIGLLEQRVNHEEVRVAAAHHLGPTALEAIPLYQRIALDATEPVALRKTCVAILGETRQSSILPALIAAANDEAVEVRMAALYALRYPIGATGNGVAETAVAESLTHEDTRIRISAARALAEWGASLGLSTLEQAVAAEKDAGAREEMREAIRRIKARLQ